MVIISEKPRYAPEQKRSIPDRHDDSIGCTPAQLLRNLVREGLRPMKEEGVPHMACIVGGLRSLACRTCNILARTIDTMDVCTVTLQLGQLRRRCRLRHIDIARYTRPRTVCSDRATGIAGRILNHMSDTQMEAAGSPSGPHRGP